MNSFKSNVLLYPFFQVFDSLADLALIVDSENDYKSNEESGECSGSKFIVDIDRLDEIKFSWVLLI